MPWQLDPPEGEDWYKPGLYLWLQQCMASIQADPSPGQATEAEIVPCRNHLEHYVPRAQITPTQPPGRVPFLSFCGRCPSRFPPFVSRFPQYESSSLFPRILGCMASFDHKPTHIVVLLTADVSSPASHYLVRVAFIVHPSRCLHGPVEALQALVAYS